MIKLNELIGSTVLATDGELGTVDDVLFDDRDWDIRYLVIRTGSWLTTHLVLIAPQAVQRVEHKDELVAVRLSREEIRQSLPADSVQTVASQQQQILDTYGLPLTWWGDPYPSGWGAYPIGIPTSTIDPETRMTLEQDRQRRRDELAGQDVHLRSFTEIKDYNLRTPDDEFGHLEDLMVDEVGWHIRFLDIDTRNFFPSDHVLLEPGAVTDIDWQDRVVRVGLSKDQVLKAPTAPPR